MSDTRRPAVSETTEPDVRTPVPVIVKFKLSNPGTNPSAAALTILDPGYAIVISLDPNPTLGDIKFKINYTVCQNRFGIKYPSLSGTINKIDPKDIHLLVSWDVNNVKTEMMPRLHLLTNDDALRGLKMMANRGWRDFLHAEVTYENDELVGGPEEATEKFKPVNKYRQWKALNKALKWHFAPTDLEWKEFFQYCGEPTQHPTIATKLLEPANEFVVESLKRYRAKRQPGDPERILNRKGANAGSYGSRRQVGDPTKLDIGGRKSSPKRPEGTSSAAEPNAFGEDEAEGSGSDGSPLNDHLE